MNVHLFNRCKLGFHLNSVFKPEVIVNVPFVFKFDFVAASALARMVVVIFYKVIMVKFCSPGYGIFKALLQLLFLLRNSLGDLDIIKEVKSKGIQVVHFHLVPHCNNTLIQIVFELQDV